jgi:hypothetical protein
VEEVVMLPVSVIIQMILLVENSQTMLVKTSRGNAVGVGSLMVRIVKKLEPIITPLIVHVVNL